MGKETETPLVVESKGNQCPEFSGFFCSSRKLPAGTVFLSVKGEALLTEKLFTVGQGILLSGNHCLGPAVLRHQVSRLCSLENHAGSQCEGGAGVGEPQASLLLKEKDRKVPVPSSSACGDEQVPRPPGTRWACPTHSARPGT